MKNGLCLLAVMFSCIQGAFAQAFDPNKTSDDFVKPPMYYTDTAFGGAFAKDPDVVSFKDRYYLYYSTQRGANGYAIGIAVSDNLIDWRKTADLLPAEPYEQKGLCAPAAIVLNGKVHLFYQTYGNGPRDAICHAVSEDGIRFQRNATNPVFSPTGSWNCGRAIDADVFIDGSKIFLYWATRDPAYKIQQIGVSSASLDSGFNRGAWTQLCDAPILKPELPWEQDCIEAPSVFKRQDRYYMFYAGAYNAHPQQIGAAVSENAVDWKRLSDQPLLPNGQPGAWNAHESGHPGVFTDEDGKMYLFFQGTRDKGKTWYLSQMEIQWDHERPRLFCPETKTEAR